MPSLPLLLCLAALAPSLARQRPHHHKPGHRKTKSNHQPHVVLIVADDLGYNDVPWHNPSIQVRVRDTGL